MRCLCLLACLYISLCLRAQDYYSSYFTVSTFNTVAKNFFIADDQILCVGGCNDTFAGTVQTYILKMDVQGNALSYTTQRHPDYKRWVSPQGLAGSNLMKISSGYIASGFAEPFQGYSKGLFVKYDAIGDTVLSRVFDLVTAQGSAFSCIDVTQADNVLCAGFPLDDGVGHLWIVSMDSMGNKLWEKSKHIGSTVFSNSVRTIHELPNHDILVTGDYSNSFNWEGVTTENHISSTLIAVLDSAGNEKWHFIDPDPNANAPVFFPTSDGGFISCGSYRYDAIAPYTEYFKPYIVKWNANLQKEWERYDYALDSILFPYHIGSRIAGIFENPDGTFLAYGNFNSSSLLLKLNSSGEELWSKKFRAYDADSTRYFASEFTDAKTLADGTIIVLGNVTDYEGYLQPSQQGWLLHLTANGCLPTATDDCIETAPPPDRYDPPKHPPHDSLSIAIAPTLVTDAIQILVSGYTDTLGLSVQVFSALGQVIHEQAIAQAQNKILASHWPSGTYAVVLRQHGQIIRVVKVLKI